MEIQFSYTNKEGKIQQASRFLPMAEAKNWDALYMSMEVQNIYGKRQTKPGKKGYWKKTSAGTREQMKDGWTRYTNTPVTVNGLQDYLLDIYFSRKDTNDRDTTAITGTIGSTNFHNALVAVANGFLTVDSNYIRSAEGRGSTPGLSYGSQFTRYFGPEGVSVKLGLNAMYDDRMYCKRMHPQYTNFPIDSARLTFANLGRSGGEQNLMMLKVKDTFRWGYRSGTHSPTGPVKGGSVSALTAGYSVFCEGTSGMWIKDVSQTGEYILDYEY